MSNLNCKSQNRRGENFFLVSFLLRKSRVRKAGKKKIFFFCLLPYDVEALDEIFGSVLIHEKSKVFNIMNISLKKKETRHLLCRERNDGKKKRKKCLCCVSYEQWECSVRVRKKKIDENKAGEIFNVKINEGKFVTLTTEPNTKK